MKKKCLSCAQTFSLSGSGKRQKYCSECAKRGDGRVWGLSASNPLNNKPANRGISVSDLGACVRAQRDDANPIRFTAPDGRRYRAWLASDKRGNKIIGDERW